MRKSFFNKVRNILMLYLKFHSTKNFCMINDSFTRNKSLEMYWFIVSQDFLFYKDISCVKFWKWRQCIFIWSAYFGFSKDQQTSCMNNRFLCSIEHFQFSKFYLLEIVFVKEPTYPEITDIYDSYIALKRNENGSILRCQ